MTDRPASEHAGLIQQGLRDLAQRLRADGVPILDIEARTLVHTDNAESARWEGLAGQSNEPRMILEYRRRAAALREREEI